MTKDQPDEMFRRAVLATTSLVITSQVTYGTNHQDTIRTGRNDDIIYALNANDTIYSGPSNDTVYGSNGNDTIYGEAGSDLLYGENGSDYLIGGSGGDTLDGGRGDDYLDAGTGDDRVLAGEGNDLIFAGRGNDTVQGDSGSDVIAGGLGDDTIIFNRGDGQDTIIPDVTDPEWVSSGCKFDEGYDTLKLGANPLDLIFSKSWVSLDVSIKGTCDSVSIVDLGSGKLVDQFVAADGRALLNNQVDLLIQAMATFCSDNHLSSWSQAVQKKPEEVQQVLANFWQPQH